MKKQKKFGLVAPILIVLLLVVILSYFIEGRSGISYVALGDLVIDYVQSFYYFFDVVLFVFVVGGLYGALNKVPAYKKLLNNIASKIGKKKELFVSIFTIFFVLLTAIGGFNFLALVFIPFVVSIILLLGYDKLTALTSTVVATFVGVIGGIFLTFRDGTNQYATSFTTFDKITGLNDIWANIIPRIVLLVVCTLLLVFFVIRHIRKTERNKEAVDTSDVFYVETKTKTGMVVKEDSDKVKVWPLVVLLSLMFVFLVLGYMPWGDLFGIACFDDFHTWLTGLKIGDYAVFTSLISRNITAFGRWGDMGNFMMAIMCIFVFLLLVKCVYRVKFKEMAKGFVYGARKFVPAIMIMVLAYTVLVAAYNNGFMETLITKASESFGDNIMLTSLLTIAGSILNVDLFYIVSGIVSPIVTSLTDKADLNVYAILFQSIYGIVQMFGPTSLLLIIGLTYLDVPYSKWLKHIWRLLLALFIIMFIVLIVLTVV